MPIIKWRGGRAAGACPDADADNEPLSLCAIHEASHATVAVCYGLSIEEACIAREGEYTARYPSVRGYVQLAGTNADSDNFENTVVDEAGEVADAIFFGRERATGTRDQLNAMQKRAWLAERLLPDADPDERADFKLFLRHGARAVAADLIRRNRTALLTLARALQQCGFLTGAEIVAVLKRAGGVTPGVSLEDFRRQEAERNARIEEVLARRERERRERERARWADKVFTRPPGDGYVIAARGVAAHSDVVFTYTPNGVPVAMVGDRIVGVCTNMPLRD
jgi:hypothetical protein